MLLTFKCPGADSNRDAFRHYPLKIACLPVSPPGREAGKIAAPSNAVNFKQHQLLEAKWAAFDGDSVEEYHGTDWPQSSPEAVRVGPISVVPESYGRTLVQPYLHVVAAAADQVSLSIPDGDVDDEKEYCLSRKESRRRGRG
jgi:hypothetical protein